MSRSRKKPLPGTKDTFRTEIAYCDDWSMGKWKRQYNREMRRKNHEHETAIARLDNETIEEDESVWMNDPIDLPSRKGDTWLSPGDGQTEVVASEWWNGKTYQPGMK